jgi:hypothetical protein
MPEVSKLSLNAGELSDELSGRIDLGKFNSGCEILENARVLRAGGITRRAGFKYIADCSTPAAASRLLGFRFDAGEGYIIELSNLKMRVFYQGLVVSSTSSGITTPWTTAQIFDIQFAQRIDRIVVTHPEHPVHNIIRAADGSWSVSELPWTDHIWETFPSNDEFILTPGATTGNTTITSSADLFDNTWVGDRIKIEHTVGEALTELNVSVTLGTIPEFAKAVSRAVGDKVWYYAGGVNRIFKTCIAAYPGSTSNPADLRDSFYDAFFEVGVEHMAPTAVKAGWVFETFDTWSGTYWVQRSYNEGATWNTIKIISSSDSRNERVTELETEDALIRVIIPTFWNNNPYKSQFTVSSYVASGNAIVTSWAGDPKVVAVTVVKDFNEATPSTVWYEAALSPRNGYPSAVTFHQGRLCLAGTSSRPQTLWLSQTQKPFDFGFGSLATDGMSFQTDAEGYESIIWLSSHLSLLIGTTIGVWALSAPDSGSISPENHGLNRQMQLGAQPGFQAVPLQNNVLFLEKNGRKIQELTGGSVEYGGYKSTDLTQLATHVTRKGISQIVAGSSPDSSLFMVNGGEISMLTYERSQNVVGWSRMTTGGPLESNHSFASFATTSGNGEDDHYYAVVNRGGYHYIERMAPDMLRIEEDNNVDNLRFLDSYTEVSGVGITSVSGLGRLNGMYADTFIDGEPAGSVLVTGGIATLPYAGNNVVVGLPYTTTVRPMSLDFSSIASKSSISEVLIRFRNSLGGEVSQDGDNWSKVEQLQPITTGGDPLSLLSSDYQSTPHSTWGRKTSISVRQTQPLPMTILAMRIKTKTSR